MIDSISGDYSVLGQIDLCAEYAGDRHLDSMVGGTLTKPWLVSIRQGQKPHVGIIIKSN